MEQQCGARVLELAWQHAGRGDLRLADGSAELTSPARYDSYPQGWPEDGDYTSFGRIEAFAEVPHENWESYTHLRLTIACECVNVVNPYITVQLVNEGSIAMPDEYGREGYHIIDLKNHESREYLFDISGLPRDAISRLSVSYQANGSYMNLPGSWRLRIERVALEARPDQARSGHGWEPHPADLSFSQIGYAAESVKLAVANACHVGEAFRVLDTAGEAVFEGAFARCETAEGTFAVADFSQVRIPGDYRLEAFGARHAVHIANYDALTAPTLEKCLNFVAKERCGCPVEGMHGSCHHDVYAEFEGAKVPFCGGWHDAGDLSQQTVQTAETALGLLKGAASCTASNSELSARLFDEARWGLDFILSTRLGGGWRATSAGVSRWTDGRIGTMDDAKARVHNSPYDNFLITGIEAQAVLLLPEGDPLKETFASILTEDYADAMRGFEKAPYQHDPIFWEHTYPTSMSLYAATVVWAAAGMYAATGDAVYKEDVRTFLADLLACQDSEDAPGAFFRDRTRRVYQHFNHQAREHMYAWALRAAIEALGAGALDGALSQAADRYAGYLSSLVGHAGAYPMIASGVYRRDEVEDAESFARQHLLVDERAKAEWDLQLNEGPTQANGLVLKRFPVWFSFRGNNAVLLSMAEAAAVMGALTDDPALREAGFAQMQWICGFNPFAESLMYGFGERWPELYAALCGQMEGALPVGIQTFSNEDAPYWPSCNNATYKEVWVGLAGKWLSLASELSGGERVCAPDFE